MADSDSDDTSGHDIAHHARRSTICGVITFAVTFALYAVWIAVRFGLNEPPSATGDEPSYDSIAWELSQGNGFAVDYSDPEFRQPYEQAAKQQPELYTLPDTTAGPVTMRPPMFPLIMSMINRVCGRQFLCVRLFNIACMAATSGLLAWFLSSRFGLVTALITIALFGVDVRTRLYARAILTEPLACLLAAMLTILLDQYIRANQRRIGTAASIGLLAGLSVLTRSIALLWIPVLMVVMHWNAVRVHRQSAKQFIGEIGVTLLIAMLVLSPWAIRNIRLLDRFAPTGTQGLMELSAGYSDTAWQNYGIWQNLASSGWYDNVVSDDMTTIERELAVAEESRRRAIDWCRNNADRLPVLVGMKIASEVWPRTPVEVLIAALILTGLVPGTIRTNAAALAMIIINLAAVGLTWSVAGRFQVPMLFPVYVLAGSGISGLIQYCRRPD